MTALCAVGFCAVSEGVRALAGDEAWSLGASSLDSYGWPGEI